MTDITIKPSHYEYQVRTLTLDGEDGADSCMLTLAARNERKVADDFSRGNWEIFALLPSPDGSIRAYMKRQT